jgi:hypothetical protein
MSCHDAEAQVLGQLAAPRRNRYFYGKLMDVLHFEMEQCYMNNKRWLLNRLSLGQGVLCGLGVKLNNNQICVTPGVAIDRLGREILVPVQMCIDPWSLTDDCGCVQTQLARGTDHNIYICLAYNECLTDYAPVLVADCNTKEDCAASTTVETFKILVREGVPPLPGNDICQALAGKAGMSNAQRRDQLCEMLSGPCADPKDNICVVLATVQLKADGTIGAVDTCTYRPVLYSNDMLLDMILCLAERIDECCGPKALIKVEQVQFLDQNGNVIATLSDPTKEFVITPKSPVSSIQVTFTEPVNVATVKTGTFNDNPKTFSFLVRDANAVDPDSFIPGSIASTADPKVIIFSVADKIVSFYKGDFVVSAFGNKDPGNLRPAISDMGGARLDGEPTQLPSGDNSEGGDFIFKFSIA